MNVLVAIMAIAAGLVLAPVILILFVAVAIDAWNCARGWLEARGSCL
jgi:hypothetical protein